MISSLHISRHVVAVTTLITNRTRVHLPAECLGRSEEVNEAATVIDETAATIRRRQPCATHWTLETLGVTAEPRIGRTVAYGQASLPRTEMGKRHRSGLLQRLHY